MNYKYGIFSLEAGNLLFILQTDYMHYRTCRWLSVLECQRSAEIRISHTSPFKQAYISGKQGRSHGGGGGTCPPQIASPPCPPPPQKKTYLIWNIMDKGKGHTHLWPHDKAMPGAPPPPPPVEILVTLLPWSIPLPKVVKAFTMWPRDYDWNVTNLSWIKHDFRILSMHFIEPYHSPYNDQQELQKYNISSKMLWKIIL